MADFIGLSSTKIRLAGYLEQEAPYFSSRSSALLTSQKEHSVLNVSRQAKKGKKGS